MSVFHRFPAVFSSFGEDETSISNVRISLSSCVRACKPSSSSFFSIGLDLGRKETILGRLENQSVILSAGRWGSAEVRGCGIFLQVCRCFLQGRPSDGLPLGCGRESFSIEN